ncbi:MAG: O-antigen ligase family protein [Salinivirgaceae bacterium]|nr:O-antigen ligase family protein [Salinivirgaceae bacterium]
MTAVYLIIGIIAIIAYQCRRFVSCLMCFMALFTNMFMFFPSELEGIRPTDVALVCTFAILMLNINIISSIPKDKYYKYSVLILLYICFQFIYTIVIKAESISFTLKVLRIPALISFMFVIRTIPFAAISKFLKVAFVITVVDGVFFYLEFVGVDFLPNVHPLDKENVYSCTLPVFTFVFIFCCLTKYINIRYKNIFLVFFLGILILSFVRTWLYGFVICAGLLLFLQRTDRKLVLRYATIAIVVLPIILNAIDKKDSFSKADSHRDMENILSGDFLNPKSNINAENGTFAYRLSMLAERVEYLWDNPDKIIFGVGAIHEGSPNNIFNFYLGTSNQIYEMCMIESGDITWVPITLRYGFVGILLYLYFYILLFANSVKRKDEYIVMAPIALFYFIASFSSAFFEQADSYFVICILLGVMSKVEEQETYCVE